MLSSSSSFLIFQLSRKVKTDSLTHISVTRSFLTESFYSLTNSSSQLSATPNTQPQPRQLSSTPTNNHISSNHISATMTSQWVCCQCLATGRSGGHCDWVLHGEPYSPEAYEALQEQWSSFDNEYTVAEDDGEILVFCNHEKCEGCAVWNPQHQPQPQPAVPQVAPPQPVMFPQPPPWLWPPQPRNNVPRGKSYQLVFTSTLFLPILVVQIAVPIHSRASHSRVKDSVF